MRWVQACNGTTMLLTVLYPRLLKGESASFRLSLKITTDRFVSSYSNSLRIGLTSVPKQNTWLRITLS
ncbi:MAG: hypothetical protein ACOY4Q_01655 [Bacillota bacterium]